MEAKLKAVEVKAMAVIEKHIEGLSAELIEIAKEAGDVEIEKASPIVKVIYLATKDQLAGILKGFIVKLDLDKDGK